MNELESPELEPVATIAPETALEAEPELAPETVPEPEPMRDFTPGPVEAPPAEPPLPIAAEPLEAPPVAPIEEPPAEPDESFADLLRDFERSHSHRAPSGRKQLEGTVISVSADQVFLDIGYKTEGVLPRSAFENNAEDVKPGDVFPVSVTGRNEEHYYELSRFKVAQPRDWTALEAAFNEKLAVVGTVTAVIKGGLSVDVGVRAFMPASRSGTRDAAELEALVGTEITCRITKLDVTDEDVVVDRRVVLEEQARGLLDQRRAAFKEGDTVSGTVRTLVPYGAFVDIGGVDGLLHISDISRTRISKPEEVLTAGQEIQVRILKIDPETKKISLGLKQLQPEPWETAAARYQTGQRVPGTVTRVTDFGAFVEIEPGLEGLIHISEMSWAKKIRHPSDMLKQGDRVDTVVLSVKSAERRIALGLKQALADPWLDVQSKFPAGSQVEGTVTKIMAFGAFIEIAEGVEGLVHISEIAAGRRLNHPGDVLRVGQRVQALVLAIDTEKRQIKLSIKQLIPTSIDEYIAEHQVGDTVSGRVVEFSPAVIQVELGDGIRGTCRTGNAPSAEKTSSGAVAAASSGRVATSAQSPSAPDLSQLSSMLKDRWKGNVPAPSAQPEPLAEGQIRTFTITKLDADAKKIEVELA